MASDVAARKPLGRRAYGSVPHLIGSRRGPADHGVNDGQHRIATAARRDPHDFVVVQEKLDGSNVCVARVGGDVVPLTRAGYHADTSPYAQHHRFARWVGENRERFAAALADGERVCGEWLYQAHGTRYDLPHEPFVAFDVFRGDARLSYAEFADWCGGRFVTPKVLHAGGPLAVEDAMGLLGDRGFHGATDPAEGAVWRVERRGRPDFLCKYVRPDKVDGKYLPEVSGRAEVLNTWPGRDE